MGETGNGRPAGFVQNPPLPRHVGLLCLALLLPLGFAACSDSPSGDAAEILASEDTVLRFVPADTPYVFAAVEPLPEDVRNKFAPHVQSIVHAYSSMIVAGLEQQSQDPRESGVDSETRERIKETIREFADMVTPEGIPEAGVDKNATAAVYGVGLLPVLRVTLSDGPLFESAMDRLEDRSGRAMHVASIEGHSYRYVEDDDGRFVIAVLDDHLVVSVTPTDMPEGRLKALLGIDLPARSIAGSGGLAALAGKYGYAPYGLGMIDVERIAATFLDDQAGVNQELLARMDYNPADLDDVCRTEIRSLAGIVPRVVTGYTEVTEEHVQSNTIVELRGDLAAGLGALTASVPGLGNEQGGLASFGMSLDLLAAREFYAARLDALEADPFECELFADLQASVARGRALLNQPVPPIVYAFRGFLAVIDDVQGMDLQNRQPPTEIDMRLLVASGSAEGLLAIGAMFSPELAALNLQADSKPVKLVLPALGSRVDSVWLAMSDSALAVSIGEGSESGLERMLAAPAAEPAPFLSMTMDAARYYGFIGDAMTVADSGEDNGEAREGMVSTAAQVMKAFERLFSRISFDVRFTGNGIEMPSTMELAD